jgi:hypothetical protein
MLCAPPPVPFPMHLLIYVLCKMVNMLLRQRILSFSRTHSAGVGPREDHITLGLLNGDLHLPLTRLLTLPVGCVSCLFPSLLLPLLLLLTHSWTLPGVPHLVSFPQGLPFSHIQLSSF